MYCSGGRIFSKSQTLYSIASYSYFSAINNSYDEKNPGKLKFGVWPERNFL